MSYAHPYRFGFTLLAVGLVLAILIAGCGSVPKPDPVPIGGNHQCHPSSDLPSHKTMKKLPEQDMLLDDFWGLFAGERKDHRTDINDYNSLWDQCVKAPSPETHAAIPFRLTARTNTDTGRLLP